MNNLENIAAKVRVLSGEEIDEVRLDVCVINAVAAVREYVHRNNIDVTELYPYQIAQLAFYYYKSFDDMNIQSKSQGNRSITYSSKSIPEDIRRALPRYAQGF